MKGEIRRCPECGSEVLLSENASIILGKMDIGCNNIDEHEDGKPLVMWRVEGEYE